MNSIVLDASALLAVLNSERGADKLKSGTADDRDEQRCQSR